MKILKKWSEILAKKLRKKAVVENLSQDYLEVAYEMTTFHQKFEMLTDRDLMEHVSELADIFGDREISKICVKLETKKDLTPEERKKLEGFYILANGDFTCED